MVIDRDRRLGIQLAKAIGATKTLAIIENKDVCFGEILQTGVAEKGLDVLVSQVLQGPPDWAHMALLCLSDVGSQRAALLQKAAEISLGPLMPDSGNLGATNLEANKSLMPATPISAMSLHNLNVSSCRWTLKWLHGGSEQPTASYPDPTSWLWSNLPQESNGSWISLARFQLPAAPLHPGDRIWMCVLVDNGHVLTTQGITELAYDPLGRTASFALGATQILVLTSMGIRAHVGGTAAQGETFAFTNHTDDACQLTFDPKNSPLTQTHYIIPPVHYDQLGIRVAGRVSATVKPDATPGRQYDYLFADNNGKGKQGAAHIIVTGRR